MALQIGVSEGADCSMKKGGDDHDLAYCRQMPAYQYRQ